VSTPAASSRPVAISDRSRRTLVTAAGLSTLIISSLVMLMAGIVIGYVARKRMDKLSRGIT
jgi:hypothetical protein